MDPQALHYLREWQNMVIEPSNNNVSVPPMSSVNLTEGQKEHVDYLLSEKI